MNRNRSLAVTAIALGVLMAIPTASAEIEDLNTLGAQRWQHQESVSKTT